MTTWWWVRHAPVRDKEGVLYGNMDVDADCSNTALFETIRNVLPDEAHWLISPLKRARQTHAALRKNADVAPQVIDAFQEQNFGDWQGRRYSEIEWPSGAEIDLAKFCPPGGESFEHVTARVATAIEELSDRLPDNVIIVAHAGVIRAALAMALGLAGAQALKFDITPLSLTRLTNFDKGQWRVDATNQILS